MKRILTENISTNSSLNNDSVLKALLEYRNTPLPEINLRALHKFCFIDNLKTAFQLIATNTTYTKTGLLLQKSAQTFM